MLNGPGPQIFIPVLGCLCCRETNHSKAFFPRLQRDLHEANKQAPRAVFFGPPFCEELNDLFPPSLAHVLNLNLHLYSVSSYEWLLVAAFNSTHWAILELRI